MRFRKTHLLDRGWKGRIFCTEDEKNLDNPLTLKYSAEWHSAPIPSPWQRYDWYRDGVEKVIYLLDFPFSKREERVYRLRFDGIFYRTTVFLNSKLIGKNQGYFFPFEFDVTDILRAENSLLLIVESPIEREKRRKRTISGIFTHWDAMDVKKNPGGIWGGVYIVESSTPYIKNIAILCERVDRKMGEASLLCITRFGSSYGKQIPLKLNIRFTPYNFSGEEGETNHEFVSKLDLPEETFRFTLKNPHLWFPFERGEQNLYLVTCTLLQGEGEVLDQVSIVTGIRDIRMEDYIFTINSERIFLKGTNIAPLNPFPENLPIHVWERELKVYRDSHHNLLRIHAHISCPTLYEAADNLGLLIWCDFPLHWYYDKSILPEAIRQAKEMVLNLGSHPSIIIWNMHNEPFDLIDTKDTSLKASIRFLRSSIRNYNRDRMDKKLEKEVGRLDPTRPVNRCSGDFGIIRRGGDTHIYAGWYPQLGGLETFDRIIKILRKNIRFVSEFGAQAFPSIESTRLFSGEDRPDDNACFRLEREHLLQFQIMKRWIGEEDFSSFERLVEASQTYQAELLRYYIDRLRLHKYRPTGGFLYFMGKGVSPGVDWSVIDWRGIPKKGFDMVKNCFCPLYSFAIFENKKKGWGDSASIYIANDLPEERRAVKVRLEVKNLTDIVLSQEWAVDLEGDSETVRLGRISIPETATELLLLTDSGRETSINRYEKRSLMVLKRHSI